MTEKPISGIITQQNASPPENKRPRLIPGKVIKLAEKNKTEPSLLADQVRIILPQLIEQGWCVYLRNEYIGLTGFIGKETDYIPEKDRKPDTFYEDYTDKDGIRKTREYIPRDERLISIGSMIPWESHQTDTKETNSKKWEVKTHWTIQRHIFDDFQTAWNIFLEIEGRYDPRKIVWSRLQEYDNFEKY